ncbi:FtsX-like permease family protein [Candidatus Bathyarchaeota archaeon]|nr:FtsX-like permease family protein [Candidatus Bathyarchaeota archaeon]
MVRHVKLGDIAKISLEGINERRFRFALNLLGILIGCAAVTGLISITQGMNAEITGQLDILGANTIMILPGESSGTLSGPQALNTVQFLDWRDREIIRRLPEIENVAAMQSNYANYEITGEKYTAQVMGVDTEIFEINTNFEIGEGRELTRNDKASVVIGSNVAWPSSKDDPVLEVGDRVRLTALGTKANSEMTFRIVGIIKKQGGVMGVNPDDLMVIPLRASEQLYDSAGEYTIIQALVRDSDDVEVVQDTLKEKFEDITIVTAQTALDAVGRITGIIESVLAGIAGISLLVAGIGIINTMTVSVSERTREIGTMKAIGAKRNDILQIFLAEAAYSGVIGGFLGAGLGFVLGKFIGNYIGLPVEVSSILWTSVIIFAMIVSLMAGAWPALRASNMDPVNALRHE